MINNCSDTQRAIDYTIGYFSSDAVPIEEKRDTLSKIISVYKSNVSLDAETYKDIIL